MITDAKHGFSAPSSGKKMNPLEKAEVSGIASGATMEELSLYTHVFPRFDAGRYVHHGACETL